MDPPTRVISADSCQEPDSDSDRSVHAPIQTKNERECLGCYAQQLLFHLSSHAFWEVIHFFQYCNDQVATILVSSSQHTRIQPNLELKSGASSLLHLWLAVERWLYSRSSHWIIPRRTCTQYWTTMCSDIFTSLSPSSFVRWSEAIFHLYYKTIHARWYIYRRSFGPEFGR